jgi:hypothetical protein
MRLGDPRSRFSAASTAFSNAEVSLGTNFGSNADEAERAGCSTPLCSSEILFLDVVLVPLNENESGPANGRRRQPCPLRPSSNVALFRYLLVFELYPVPM